MRLRFPRPAKPYGIYLAYTIAKHYNKAKFDVTVTGRKQSHF